MITFGSRVIKHILDIHKQGGGGKYLGLPEQFGPKKKEIMLKSVALAMLVYSMSCFKLLKGVISEIDSLLMNYWWSRDSEKRGIPWISWKRLQYSKRDGGLGFKDLEKFNDALLAKHAWRIINNPDSLFARIMKARYFKDCFVLDAKERPYQSDGWSSLLVGIALLKKGTRYIVGDGKTIRVASDSLLDTHPPRPIRLSRETENITLDKFIKSRGEHRYWDEHMINTHISPEDQPFLRRIHLPREVSKDSLIWNYNKSGDYTVRSGYWLNTHDPGYVGPYTVMPHGSLEIKNRRWKLPIQPKIKHFLWKALSKALATATRLSSRGVAIDTKCPRCLGAEETINHVLLTCPFSTVVWRLAHPPSQELQHPSEDLEANIKNILDLRNIQGISKVNQFLPFWLLWRIWKSRNNFVFNQHRESPSKTVFKAQAEVKEWLNITSKETSERNETVVNSRSFWSRPPLPFVKCNFDASFNSVTSHATGGWLIRDHAGSTKEWASTPLYHTTSPLEA